MEKLTIAIGQKTTSRVRNCATKGHRHSAMQNCWLYSLALAHQARVLLN